jgi:hypothetical protein
MYDNRVNQELTRFYANLPSMSFRKLILTALVSGCAICAGVTATRAVVASGAQVEPETPNVVYYVNPKDNSFVPLALEVAKMSVSVNSLTGVVDGQLIVQGEKSQVRLKLSQKAEFVVQPADPSQYFGIRLERFEIKDGKRILKFVKDPKPSDSADQPGLLAFDTTHHGKSSSKISVPYDLPPGEYGITVSPHKTSPKVYSFGVDSP